MIVSVNDAARRAEFVARLKRYGIRSVLFDDGVMVQTGTALLRRPVEHVPDLDEIRAERGR